MRRTAVLGVLLAMVVVPRAEAAPSVPAPTLAVSVKAQGQALPKATVDAKWIVGQPGENARLTVDARNAAGMVTIVDATWTSQSFRVYPDIPAVEYKIETTHDGAPSSSMPASFSYGFRYREAGGRWTQWFDRAEAYQAGVPLQGHFSEPAITFGNGRKKPMQIQFRIHTEIADTSNEHQSWSFLANV